jgi:hypothetical protein
MKWMLDLAIAAYAADGMGGVIFVEALSDVPRYLAPTAIGVVKVIE